MFKFLNKRTIAMSQQTMDLLKACIPTFTILSDENRHQILNLLFEQGKMSVNQLAEQLPISRPAVSHHLRLMLNAKMVTVERIGTERFYSAQLDESEALLHQVLQAFAQAKQTS